MMLFTLSYLLNNLTPSDWLLETPIWSPFQHTQLNRSKNYAIMVKSPYNEKVEFNLGVVNIVDLHLQRHPGNKCYYYAVDIGKKAKLSNAVFMLNINLTIPDYCKDSYIAPFGSVFGVLENISVVGVLNLTKKPEQKVEIYQYAIHVFGNLTRINSNTSLTDIQNKSIQNGTIKNNNSKEYTEVNESVDLTILNSASLMIADGSISREIKFQYKKYINPNDTLTATNDERLVLYIATATRKYFEMKQIALFAQVFFFKEQEKLDSMDNADCAVYFKQGFAMVVCNTFVLTCTNKDLLKFDGIKSECVNETAEQLLVSTNLLMKKCPNGQQEDSSSKYCQSTLVDAANGNGMYVNLTLKTCDKFTISYPSDKPCVEKCEDFSYKKGCFDQCPIGTIENINNKSCKDPEHDCGIEYRVHTRSKNSIDMNQITYYCSKTCPPGYYQSENDTKQCYLECPTDTIADNGKCVSTSTSCSNVNGSKTFAKSLVKRIHSCSNLCKHGEYSTDNSECQDTIVEQNYIHQQSSLQLCETDYDGGIFWIREENKCTDKCAYYNESFKICERNDDDGNCELWYYDNDNNKNICVKECPTLYKYTVNNTKRCVSTCIPEIPRKYQDDFKKMCVDNCTHYHNISNTEQRVCTNTETCIQHSEYNYSVYDITLKYYVCYKNCPDIPNRFVTNEADKICGECASDQSYKVVEDVIDKQKFKILTCVKCNQNQFADFDTNYFSDGIKRCEDDCKDFSNPPGPYNIIWQNTSKTCTYTQQTVKIKEECGESLYLYNEQNNTMFSCDVSKEDCYFTRYGDMWIYTTKCETPKLPNIDGCYKECDLNCKQGQFILPNNTCADECPTEYPYKYETGGKLYCYIKCPAYTNVGEKECVSECPEKFYEIINQNKHCVAGCDEKYFILQNDGYTKCLPANCSSELTHDIQFEATKQCIQTCDQYSFTKRDGEKFCYSNCTVYQLSQENSTKTCSEQCTYYVHKNTNYCVNIKCPDNETEKYPFLDVEQNRCVAKCTPPLFANEILKKCDECEFVTNKEGTLYCTNTINCANLSIPGKPVECVNECPDNGLFFNKVCDKQLCCNISDCTNHSFVIGDTKECADSCPKGYYSISQKNRTCVKNCSDNSFKEDDGLLYCVPFDNVTCEYYVVLDGVYQCYDNKCPNGYQPTETEKGWFECKNDGKCEGYWLDTICVSSCWQNGLFFEEVVEGKKQCTDCKSQHYVPIETEKECVESTDIRCPYTNSTLLNNTSPEKEYQQCVQSCPAVDNKNQTKCVANCNKVHEIKADGVHVCYDNCGESNVNKYLNGSVCVDNCQNFITDLGINGYNCTFKCETKYYEYDDVSKVKKCVVKCEKNYTFNADEGMLMCIDECKSEIYINQGECVEKCSGNKFLFNGRCIDHCPLNASFVDNGLCISKCKENTYIEKDGKKECVPQCLKEQKKVIDPISGDIKCIDTIQCKDGMVFYEDDQCIYIQQCSGVISNGQCLTQCPEGFARLNSASNICEPIENCKGAIINIGKEMVCVTICPSNKPVVINGECKAIDECTTGSIGDGNICQDSQECKNGYYWYNIEINGVTVKKCDKKCPNFAPKLNGTQCQPLINCGDFFVLNFECVDQCPQYISGKTCVSSCSEGQYLNQVTKTCEFQCLSGIYIFDTATSTKICQENNCPFYEYPDGTDMYMCVQSCNETYPYVEDKKCQNSCPGGKFQINNDNGQYECKEQCDGKMLYSHETGLFQCVANCNNGYQLNDSTCVLSCSGIYHYVHGNKCVLKCSEGNEYYQQGEKETFCQSKCDPSSPYIDSPTNLTCVSCIKDNLLYYYINDQNVRICQINCESFSNSRVEAEVPTKIIQCHNMPENCSHTIVSTHTCATECKSPLIELIVSDTEVRCIERCEYYMHDKQCVFKCPDDQYSIENGQVICKSCEKFVIVDGAKQCTDCPKSKVSGECVIDCISNNLSWSEKLQKCVKICDAENPYVNQTIVNNRPIEQRCVSECESAFNDVKNMCLEPYQCPYYKFENEKKVCKACLKTDILIQQQNNIMCVDQCTSPNLYYNPVEKLCQETCNQFIQQQKGADLIVHNYCISSCSSTIESSFYYEDNSLRYCVVNCAPPHPHVITDEFNFKKCISNCPEDLPNYDAKSQACIEKCVFYKGDANFKPVNICMELCDKVHLVVDSKTICFDDCPQAFEKSGKECIDTKKNKSSTAMIIIIVVCVLAALAVIAGITAYYVMKRRKAGLHKGRRNQSENTDYYAKRLHQQISKDGVVVKQVPKSKAVQKTPVKRAAPVLPGEDGSGVQNASKNTKRRGRFVQ